MSVQIQRRGGTTLEHKDFVGANREITVDTTKKTLVVHDAIKKGGFPLAREDLNNVEAKIVWDKIVEFLPEFLSFIIPVGVVLPLFGKIAPQGFLLLNGQSIGSDDSMADFKGDLYKKLYLYLWENLAVCKLSDDKGMKAIDDWDIGKALILPDARRKMLIGADLRENILDRGLGMSGGEETHKLTLNEIPPHSHQSKQGSLYGNAGNDELMCSGDDYTHAIASWTTTSTIGNGEPHNNMPPWLAVNHIIKL